MALVTKIKEFREKAGLTQADLAEKVGARRETIVHLENGKYNPSLKLAMDIAKVFDLRECWIHKILLFFLHRECHREGHWHSHLSPSLLHSASGILP